MSPGWVVLSLKCSSYLIELSSSLFESCPAVVAQRPFCTENLPLEARCALQPLKAQQDIQTPHLYRAVGCFTTL